MLRALVAALVVVGLLVAGSGAATAAHTTSPGSGVSAEQVDYCDISSDAVDGPIGGGPDEPGTGAGAC